MKSIIEDIYNGNWASDNIKMGEEYYKISDECEKLYKEIQQHLNEEQKKNLFDLMLKNGGLEGEASCANFKEGFKLGMLIALEVLR